MNFTIDQYTWPAYQGRKPFMHQIPTVKFALDNKRCFILNEMGTGKTLSAIWAADILLTALKIKRVLIVGPLSTMRSVWYNELTYNIPHRKIGIAHGNKQLRLSIINDKSIEFVIINHDGIKNSEDELIAQGFDLIIIDELTAFKSHASERSKCMERISKTVKAVWGMTGEITPNSPLEAYYPCKIVNPFNKWLPKYFGQFRDACMFKVNDALWMAKPESPQIVAMCVQPAIRFTREQCLDLPDTTYQMIETELSTEQKEWYTVMKSKALVESDQGKVTAQNAAVMLNKLLQISAGAVKDVNGNIIEIGCQPRLEQLLQIYDETPQKKLVVFATYRATIDMLIRELTARKIKCAAIHGDVNQNIRSKLIDDFQTGDLNILVLQPQSTAHGITLTAASTIVWFSLIPSNELTQQGNARIIRAGQTRKTLIIMFASTKAEKHIAKILERKGDISRETLKLFIDHDI